MYFVLCIFEGTVAADEIGMRLVWLVGLKSNLNF
jgi:hypothetical protein